MKKKTGSNTQLRFPDPVQIGQKLAGLQNAGRFRHTLGVTYTACALAMRYGCPLPETRIAGLLHDCAKHLSGEELRKLCMRERIDVSPFELEHTALLHARAGVYLARAEYGVTDLSILEAIRWHTTGKPDMTILEKIIFTADYIEPNRDRAPRLPELRQLAFQDLDRCVCEILRDTVSYLSRNPKSMDPMTRNAYAYYAKHVEKEGE